MPTDRDQPAPRTTPRSRHVPALVMRHAQRYSTLTEAIAAGLLERDRIGAERYGQSLHTHDGRDTPQDAWEEALDLAQYAVKWSAELADEASDCEGSCGGYDDCQWNMLSVTAGGIATAALDLAWRINELRERVREARGKERAE